MTLRRPAPHRDWRDERRIEREAEFMADTRGHEPFCTDHNHRGFCGDPIKPANDTKESK